MQRIVRVMLCIVPSFKAHLIYEGGLKSKFRLPITPKVLLDIHHKYSPSICLCSTKKTCLYDVICAHSSVTSHQW